MRQGYGPVDPVIDSPPDIIYEFGTTGNNITWTPASASPNHYEIYRNLELVASGHWNGSEIPIDVDGLGVGIHMYCIFVFNGAGGFAFDWVIVTFIEATTSETATTPTQTLPINIILVSIGIGSAAIIIAVLMCRSRGAEEAISTGQSGHRW